MTGKSFLHCGFCKQGVIYAFWIHIRQFEYDSFHNEWELPYGYFTQSYYYFGWLFWLHMNCMLIHREERLILGSQGFPLNHQNMRLLASLLFILKALVKVEW